MKKDEIRSKHPAQRLRQARPQGVACDVAGARPDFPIICVFPCALARIARRLRSASTPPLGPPSSLSRASERQRPQPPASRRFCSPAASRAIWPWRLGG